MGALSGQRFIVISELMSDDYFVIQHIGTSAHWHIGTSAHFLHWWTANGVFNTPFTIKPFL